MANYQGLYNIRIGKDSDKNFIYKSFLKGLYYDNSWFSQIEKAIFMHNYKKIVEMLLNKADTMIVIACLPDDEDTIIGFSILGNNGETLHWVYVKKIWRDGKIATSLLPKNISVVTHLTKLGLKLLPKLKSAVFNPFL